MSDYKTSDLEMETSRRFKSGDVRKLALHSATNDDPILLSRMPT